MASRWPRGGGVSLLVLWPVFLGKPARAGAYRWNGLVGASVPTYQWRRLYVLHLRGGDVVVVVSDGVVNQDDSFIIDAIEKFEGEPRTLARRLAERAKQLRSDGHDDDITVMAAVLA